MSRRAKEAYDKMEHYPVGSAAQWAERNWNDSVLPFMEEFLAALKRKDAPVPEEYFN